MTIKTVCVYCGSSNKVDDVYKKTAHALGMALAKNDIGLVYGGGHVGLMGIIADSVISAGGKVTGIIPKFLDDREEKHEGLTELHIVDDMHTRKHMMAERADAFIMMPGGFGTLDETFEVLTWKQLGLHTKPIVIYNVNQFWDPAVKLIENVITAGFALESNRDLFHVAQNLEDVFEGLSKEMDVPADPSGKWE